MVTAFFRVGSGAGINYLVEEREPVAKVLRGDIDQTIQLIDSLEFKQRYCSEVHRFTESDLPEKTKAEIMDSFENTIFSGMKQEQRPPVLWVQHQEKDGLRNEIKESGERYKAETEQRYQGDRERLQGAIEKRTRNMAKDTKALKTALRSQTRELKASLLLSKTWNMNMIIIISLFLTSILAMAGVIYWQKTEIESLWTEISQAKKTLKSLPRGVEFSRDSDRNYLVFEKKQETYTSTSGNWVIKLGK